MILGTCPIKNQPCNSISCSWWNQADQKCAVLVLADWIIKLVKAQPTSK